MFKFKSTILMLFLSATFALANGYFIGFSGGLNHSLVDDDNYDLKSDNNLLLSPKFGYQINNTHRYSISYEYGGKSSGSRSYDIELASALYEIDDRCDIEFGAKIMRTMYKSKDLDLSFDYGGVTYEIENKPFRLKQLDMGAYLGVSYRF